jgi:hypothetical protein
MVAGGAVIAQARRATQREHVVTEVATPPGPTTEHSVHRVVRDTERD